MCRLLHGRDDIDAEARQRAHCFVEWRVSGERQLDHLRGRPKNMIAALIELMYADPATAEPILLKMLADPHADQMLAEMIAANSKARSGLLKMSTYSSALAHAFAGLITKLN